jgi:hypothetical protein
VVEDAEPLAQRGRQHAGPGGGGHQGERLQPVLDGARVHAPLHHEVDREVLHGRVEQLLDHARQAVDLVDEEHVLRGEVAEDAEQIAAALDGGPRRRLQSRAHLVGDDAGQRGLAQAGWAVEEDVIDALAALARGLHRHPQAGDGLLLTDVLLERARPERPLELRLLGHRRAAQDAAVVRGHAHDLALAAACPR